MPDRQLEYSARFGPNLDNLILGADLVARFREETKVNIKTGDQIELAVGEALANAINHAQAVGDDAIGLTMTVEDGVLTITVDDNGIGFLPDEVPQPNFKEHPSHGYGVFIIYEVMDSVSYDSQNGINTLTMKKRLEE